MGRFSYASCKRLNSSLAVDPLFASIATLVIYDKIFLFGKTFDKKLLDPVWETVSLKISKYAPFLNIDVFQFKRILREIINE